MKTFLATDRGAWRCRLRASISSTGRSFDPHSGMSAELHLSDGAALRYARAAGDGCRFHAAGDQFVRARSLGSDALRHAIIIAAAGEASSLVPPSFGRVLLGRSEAHIAALPRS